MPIWAFHGAKDSLVPIGGFEEPINALRSLGVTLRIMWHRISRAIWHNREHFAERGIPAPHRSLHPKQPRCSMNTNERSGPGEPAHGRVRTGYAKRATTDRPAAPGSKRAPARNQDLPRSQPSMSNSTRNRSPKHRNRLASRKQMANRLIVR
jgi:hypothetical protein